MAKSGSKETMNGHDKEEATQGGQRVRLVEISMNDSNAVKSSSYQYSFEQRIVSETSDSMRCTAHTNGDIPNAKSFIQSRIERLYGPSALAAGFRSRRSLLELEKEQKDRELSGYRSPIVAAHLDNHFEPEAEAPEGFPSVFRHLRPEFRTQLQVKRNGRLKPDIVLQLPNDVESPKRPGRVIPITLTDTIEKEVKKPPVPQTKPVVPVINNVNLGNKVASKPVVVQRLLNGNGNIEETEITVNKEPMVNGNIREQEPKTSVKVDQSSTERTSKINGVPDTVKVNGDIGHTTGEKDGHYFLKVSHWSFKFLILW